MGLPAARTGSVAGRRLNAVSSGHNFARGGRGGARVFTSGGGLIVRHSPRMRHERLDVPGAWSCRRGVGFPGLPGRRGRRARAMRESFRQLRKVVNFASRECGNAKCRRAECFLRGPASSIFPSYFSNHALPTLCPRLPGRHVTFRRRRAFRPSYASNRTSGSLTFVAAPVEPPSVSPNHSSPSSCATACSFFRSQFKHRDPLVGLGVPDQPFVRVEAVVLLAQELHHHVVDAFGVLDRLFAHGVREACPPVASNGVLGDGRLRTKRMAGIVLVIILTRPDGRRETLASRNDGPSSALQSIQTVDVRAEG